MTPMFWAVIGCLALSGLLTVAWVVAMDRAGSDGPSRRQLRQWRKARLPFAKTVNRKVRS